LEKEVGKHRVILTSNTSGNAYDWELPRSNLGLYTNFADRGLPSFMKSIQKKNLGIVPKIRPRPLPLTLFHFIIRYPIVGLRVVWILTSLNELQIIIDNTVRGVPCV
jgi:hypothetical protein